MKFLVDAQMPPALARWLCSRGHAGVAIRDVGLRHAVDREIWNYATAESAVIVTKDEDFAMLAAVQSGPAVVWVRTGNLVTRLLLKRFELAWPEVLVHLESGARVVELR